MPFMSERPPNEWPFVDIKRSLSRSKRTSWRERTFLRYTTLCQFLQSNGLLNRKAIEPGEQVTPETVVYYGDLTEEGWTLVNNCIERWYDAQDRGRPLDDVQILEKALKKLRADKEKS